MGSRLCRLTGALLFSVLTACSSEPSPTEVAEGTYVGKLQGSDGMLAVTVEGGEVVAYSCGDVLTIALHTRWYQGTLEGNSVALSSDDGAAGTLTFDGDTVSGSLTQPEGDVLDLIDVARAGSDTATALFSVVDDGCRTGVIVQQTSPEVTPRVLGAWCGAAAAGNEEDIFSQVTPITPIEVGLTSLQIEVADMDKELTAVLVEPAEF
jgi:hypothetical protein